MPFASADRVQLAIIKETTPGTTPVAGNGRKLRMTGESLSFDLTKTADNEITADGQPTSSSTTNASANGDINLHMQYAEYDPLIAGVLRSSWSAFGTNGVGAAFSGTFATGTITAGAGAGFNTLQPGQWFRVNAPGNVDNDGKWFRNSTTVAATATVITLDPATPAVAAANVAGCTIATSRLTNDVTLSSFTVEKQMSDITQFMTFTGMHPSKLSISMAAESDTTGSISLMGFKAKRRTTTALPGTTAESQNYSIHSGVVGVGQLWEGGAPTSADIKSLSLDVDSALRAQTVLGTLGPVGMGIGTIAVTGSMTVYFEDGALYDKYEGDVYTSLVFSTRDTAGNGYVITIPKVMLTQAKIVAGGKNTDLMAEFQFEALADRSNAVPALRKTIIIDRLGAAVVP